MNNVLILTAFMKQMSKNTKKNSSLKNHLSEKIGTVKFTPLKVFLVITFIVASLICLSQIGKNIEYPYPLSIKTEGNYESEYKNYLSNATIIESDNASVLIDDGFTRFVVMDINHQVISVEYSPVTEDSVGYYQSVCINNNAIYVLSAENYFNTDNVKREKLNRIDFDGNYVSTIWSESYENSVDKFRIPRLINLEESRNGELYGILVSPKEDKISIVKFHDGTYDVYKGFPVNFSKETITNVTYNIETDVLSVMTDTGSIYLVDDNGEKEIATELSEDTFSKYVVFNEDNSISPINENIKYRVAPEILNFAPILIFKTLLFWICLAYIIIVIIVLIIRKFLQIIKEKNSDLLIRILIIAIAFAGILGISLYYSYQIFDKEVQTKTDLLQYSALNLRCTPNDYAKKQIKSMNNDSDFKKEDYFDFKDYLETLRQNAIESNFTMDFTIYKINKPNIMESITLCSTDILEKVGVNEGYIEYEKIKGDLDTDDNAIYIYKNIRGSYMAAYAIIYDDEESIGIAEASCNYWVYITSVIGNTLTIFVTLSVALIVLISLFSEIRAAYLSRKLKKEYDKKRIRHPEIAYNRMFAFLVNFLSSFNSVLLVLIAKDLIEASNLENATVLLALPTFFLSFGVFWGQPVFELISRRFNIKSIMVVCCIVMFVTYLMCYQAIAITNFWYFCGATLLSSLATGIMTSIRAYMPVLAPNEKIRYELNNGSTKTWISSGIVSIGVSGAISEMFGSQSIYLLALIPVLFLFIMSVFLMPNGVKYRLENQAKKIPNMFKKSMKFFFQPAFLIYAIGLISVCVLCHGYRNFLFPLFTDESGISKSMISNIIVIANFIAFVFNSQLNNLVKRMDFWELGIFTSFFAGILYLSFTLNSEIAWACFVIILITMVIRIMSTVNGMMWPRLCKKSKYPMSIANTIILCYTNIISAIQGFVFTSLLLLGMINTCICIGIFMIAVAIIYATITYNSALRSHKD